MNKIHLSPAQRAAILAAIARFQDRPSVAEYEEVQKELVAIPVAAKPKAKKIPNTRPGYEASDVKLTDTFDALVDLPAGWAVYSRYDSGGNHGITNAAVHVWTHVWNGWHGGACYSLDAAAKRPGGQGEIVAVLQG